MIATAHSYGIKVHPWTFRNENKYLLYDYESDPYLEYEKFYQLGVDGYFTDFRIVIKIHLTDTQMVFSKFNFHFENFNLNFIKNRTGLVFKTRILNDLKCYMQKVFGYKER